MPTTFLDYGNFYTGPDARRRGGAALSTDHEQYPRRGPGDRGVAGVHHTNGFSTIITTSNLNALVVAAQTNDPTLIPGLFSGRHR